MRTGLAKSIDSPPPNLCGPYIMPVAYLLFAHPFTVDSVRAVVRELQAHSESGVGATLGLYEINQVIIAKFDCASAAAEAAAEAAAREAGQETWLHPLCASSPYHRQSLSYSKTVPNSTPRH